MTKEKILQTFEDINLVYNDCTRYDTLKRMLDELQEPCEDAISRQKMLDGLASIAKARARSGAQKALMGRVMFFTEKLPPVNPQKPICLSAGIDCEDCPAYEDAISRKAVLNTLENMDRALDEDRTVESYKDLLRECYKVLPSVTPKPKSECEHDHEILKAYSDGANDVLDNIRAEISKQSRMHMDGDLYIKTSKCMQIIGEYMEEGSEE